MVDDPVFKAVCQGEPLPVALVHDARDGGCNSDDEAPLGFVVRAEWVEVSIEFHDVCAGGRRRANCRSRARVRNGLLVGGMEFPPWFGPA